jgi:hypothetical protein
MEVAETDHIERPEVFGREIWEQAIGGELLAAPCGVEEADADLVDLDDFAVGEGLAEFDGIGVAVDEDGAAGLLAEALDSLRADPITGVEGDIGFADGSLELGVGGLPGEDVGVADEEDAGAHSSV